MPIQVSWYNQQEKILLWTVGETWTLDEYYEAFYETKALLALVEQPTYAIVDATRLESRPRVGLMSHFLKVLKDVDLELLIYVRDSNHPQLVQQLLNLIVQSNRTTKVKQVQFASSMKDALDAIPLISVS